MRFFVIPLVQNSNTFYQDSEALSKLDWPIAARHVEEENPNVYHSGTEKVLPVKPKRKRIGRKI